MTPVDAPQLGWESLEARVSKLERRWKIAVAGWILTVALIMLPGWQHGGETFAENLRVRQLSVVNEKGTSRIILGAPLPDPVMGGKSQERRSPATGLVLNDSDGNER